VAWKLIVAADAPWLGEIYHTRPGNQRHRFDSVEAFCGALLAVTGWPLHALTSEPAGSARPPAAGDLRATGHQLKSKLLRGNSSGKHKFIVAADSPWVGEMYLTRPGLGRLQFTTFEGFLRSVVTMTGWTMAVSQPA
jgi:hypothetical protein